MYRILVFCLCCSHGFVAHASLEEDAATLALYEKCESLPLQQKFQMKYITGLWYVIEILQHKSLNENSLGESKFVIDICPTVTLTYPGKYDSELKLHWNEDKGDINYRFRVNETTTPGKWESSGAQTGKLIQVSNYNQFAGMVIVRKAISDHMVMTFCSPDRQLYSVVVARNKTMNERELVSIKSLMKLNKLPITETKLTCRNSSSVVGATALWTFVALWLTRAFSQ